MVSLEYSPEHGTFELQTHPEFYCSNEVIAGHIYIYMYCGKALLLCMKGIEKFQHLYP